MIAKRIPKEEERVGRKADVAAAYGLTLDEFNRKGMYSFLQAEGYHEDGHESESLHDWLTYTPKQYVDKTPWQKGDDWDL